MVVGLDAGAGAHLHAVRPRAPDREDVVLHQGVAQAPGERPDGRERADGAAVDVEHGRARPPGEQGQALVQLLGRQAAGADLRDLLQRPQLVLDAVADHHGAVGGDQLDAELPFPLPPQGAAVRHQGDQPGVLVGVAEDPGPAGGLPAARAPDS
ncbi:hypothetical protein [Kocuria rosea]|uniref:hypothetical protein n=1 Tax=Kocuria rosea TaxID=1275 RepID=UPI00203BEAC0|nr:hypothetical protein [Kocuria rosea]MCM3687633.1 hypothetical protein [Kocuria rosea]